MSIIPFIILLIAAIIGLGANYYYSYFDVIDFVKNFSTKILSINSIVTNTFEPNVPTEAYDEYSKDLKEDYKSLLTEIINYRDHSDYLIQEKEMLDKIKKLSIAKINFDNFQQKIKDLPLKDNFTTKDINTIKSLLKDN